MWAEHGLPCCRQALTSAIDPDQAFVLIVEHLGTAKQSSCNHTAQHSKYHLQYKAQSRQEKATAANTRAQSIIMDRQLDMQNSTEMGSGCDRCGQGVCLSGAATHACLVAQHHVDCAN